MKAFAASLAKEFSVTGRFSRAQYWPRMVGAALFVSLATVPAGVLTFLVFPNLDAVGNAFMTGILIVSVYAFLASVKRLHDIGWSGWWLFAFAAALEVWGIVMKPDANYDYSFMDITPFERFLHFVGQVLEVLVNNIVVHLPVYLIIGILLALIPGQKNTNKYGPVVVGKK